MKTEKYFSVAETQGMASLWNSEHNGISEESHVCFLRWEVQGDCTDHQSANTTHCRADGKGTHKANVAATLSQDSAHGCMGPVSGKLEAHELALLSFLL